MNALGLEHLIGEGGRDPVPPLLVVLPVVVKLDVLWTAAGHIARGPLALHLLDAPLRPDTAKTVMMKSGKCFNF